MTGRITSRPKMTRTVRCMCLFLPSSASVHPVFHLNYFLSTSCLTHLDFWPPLYLINYPFFQISPSTPSPSMLCLNFSVLGHLLSSSWISVLQNSKEEALNQAFKGDHRVGENNIVQELTKAILGEVKRMTGNDVCCDCGAPSESRSIPSQNIWNLVIWKTMLTLDYYISTTEMVESVCSAWSDICTETDFASSCRLQKQFYNPANLYRVVGYSYCVLWGTE